MRLIENIIREVIKESKINKDYTHFAIDKKTNKIVNGWEYKNLDSESIKEYTKMDLEDQFSDREPSEFKILKKSKLKVDPFDIKNWA
jgi:hypothetical protein